MILIKYIRGGIIWWDTSKVYCDDDLKIYKYVYESNIASEE